MKKTKICILQNGLARGGTDTFVVNLCTGLNKNRYDITVINPSNRKCSLEREPEIIATGTKILHTTPLSSLKGKLKHLYQLYKILKKERFDIFQTNVDLFNGPNLLIARLAGIKIRCCHSHNSNQQRQIIKGNTLSLKIYQIIMKSLCWKFSNRRCGCSESAMNFLFSGHDWRDNSYPQIIYNGIDLQKFSSSINITQKKLELGLSAKKHIITIGHIIQQKNPLFIAEIFSKFSKEHNDCDLIWIGDGILKQDVVKKLSSNNILNRVHFFSNRNDINEILKCADIFILPSNFEGLGIVAIEAQAANLPCILSENVPIETNCGLCIYLPINQGIDCWTRAISDNLYKKANIKLDQSNLNKFSIENMVQQMTQVFES